MQIELYHADSPLVNIKLVIEPHDRLSATRIGARGVGASAYCPKCYAVYYKRRPKFCSRCLPKKIKIKPGYLSYGKYRAFYNQKIAKLWNRPLIATPISLEIVVNLGLDMSHEPDIDNLICLISGLISKSIIIDDRLIWKSQIIKQRNNSGKIGISIYLDAHEPNYRAIIDTLSEKIPGKVVRIPKPNNPPRFKDSQTLLAEINSRFKVIQPVGEHYTNVVSWFRETNPEFNWLSDRKIAEYYRQWRILIKKGELANAGLSGKNSNPAQIPTGPEMRKEWEEEQAQEQLLAMSEHRKD